MNLLDDLAQLGWVFQVRRFLRHFIADYEQRQLIAPPHAVDEFQQLSPALLEEIRFLADFLLHAHRLIEHHGHGPRPDFIGPGEQPRHEHHELASRFLRRNSAEIRKLVSNWTGEYQFTLEQVLKDMIGRSRELKLRAAGAERSLRIEFAILLTVKTMDFHYSRRNWFAL